MKQRIEIVVKENGALAVNTGGFKGEKCIEEVKAILGADFSGDPEKTEEYYQKRQVVSNQFVYSK